MLEINTASTSSSLSSTASASTFLQLELTLAEHILSSDHRILAELNRIKNLSDEELPEPPAISTVPSMYNNISDKQKLHNIQKYIESFEYNYTGKPFLQMKKSRGSSHIQLCAKQIINAALPIQCVEAVFLGTFLSSTLKRVDRIPLSFKSKFKDGVHRHIVLAVRLQEEGNKWGCLGISRRKNLMYKSVKYDNLSALIKDFEKSYEEVFHKLLTVYIGLPLPHDVFSDQPIKWRANKVKIYKNDPSVVTDKIESFVQNMEKMNDHFKRDGVLPTSNEIMKKKEGFPVALTNRRSFNSISSEESNNR